MANPRNTEPCCYCKDHDSPGMDYHGDWPCHHCDGRGFVPAVCSHGVMRHLCGYCGACECGRFRGDRVWCDFCGTPVCRQCAIEGGTRHWKDHGRRWCSEQCRLADFTVTDLKKLEEKSD